MRQFQGTHQKLISRTDRSDSQPKDRPVSTYRVGELYHEEHKNWREGTHFTYSPNGLELTLFHRDISRNMIADVRSGLAEFAMIVEHPLIVLAYRFGDSISWNDVPYCWHLQHSGRRVIPALDPSPEARVFALDLACRSQRWDHSRTARTDPFSVIHLRTASCDSHASNDKVCTGRLHLGDFAALSQLLHDH